MHMTRDASAGQIVCYDFGQTDLAASQTNVQLNIASSETAGAVDSAVAPWPGDVIAIGYTLSAAGSAGVFTIGATKNGTENTSTTSTVGVTTEGYKRIKRGVMPIVAGDNIGAEITTDGSWDGTTADLSVQVYVLYRLEGI